MLFSVIILVVLWSLQFILLGNFYESMKLNEIKSIGDKITGSFNQPNYREILSEYAFKNNIRIIMLDENEQVTWTFDGFPSSSSDTSSANGGGQLSHIKLDIVLKHLKESPNGKISYIREDQQLGMSRSVYVAKVYNTSGAVNYLYISSPIPSIDTTVSVLKTQFLIVTVSLFFLSLIMAQWFSRKLAKPIINLTKSAQRMVNGELDTPFNDNGYTEISQLTAALNYAANELHSLDRYRREFIANVSHDLKTPLTIIKINGELIKDVLGNDAEKRSLHCDTIIKEADRLTGMVGEILELSKLESGNAEILKTDVNLSTCLTDILMSLRVLSEKEGYQFETDIEEDLIVFGNEARLKRSIYNLISNAVNFTGDDKRVIISLKELNGNVRFEVTDTGAGIKKEKQDAIWDRYYKSNETHKRAVVGTGIGLSIVKSLLTLHGAEYGVISEVGMGSTFWFELKKQ